MSQVENPGWTERQLRVALYDYVVRFAGVVNEAANEMAASTDARDVKTKALLWKVNAVPACQAAAFDADPVVGLVDTWALVVQMNDFFESAQAEEVLGGVSAIGLEATSTLEAEIETIARSAIGTGGADRARDMVAEFSAAHPIDDLDFTRASLAPELALVTEETRKSIVSTVDRLEDRMEDLTSRMTVYAAHTPRQARWEAEVFILSLLELPELARVVSLPDEIPSIVAQEREVVLETLRAEREAVLADIDRQRADTLDFVTGEREASLASIAAEREAVAAALTVERAAIFDELDRQRVETLNALRAERVATLEWAEAQREAVEERTVREANRTIDGVLWKAFLYGLALTAIPCLLLCAALLLGRGRITLDLSKRDG